MPGSDRPLDLGDLLSGRVPLARFDPRRYDLAGLPPDEAECAVCDGQGCEWCDTEVVAEPARPVDVIAPTRHFADLDVPFPTLGCRWCGVESRPHGHRRGGPVGYHQWAEPTPAQRHARMRARLRARGRIGGI
jgi:hypothetical protein